MRTGRAVSTRRVRRRIALLGGLWIIGLLCLPALRKRLIAADTTGPSACEWQSSVLSNSLSSAGHDKRLVAEELERLGMIYDRARPPEPEQAAECRKAFHDAARKLALAWHREGQQRQDNGTLALADRAYQLFLAHFADDDDTDAYEMNFFWGERLWVLGRWKDAAGQYTRVVEARPGGQFARESAYAAMLAWMKVQVSEGDMFCPREPDGFNRGEDCGTPGAEPIPEARQKLIGAIHTYAKLVPDAPQMPVMLYREALIYYMHCQFDKAEPLFLEVVEKHTKHELAMSSASMYLEALVMECKTKEVVAATRKFLDTPELMRDAPSDQHLIHLVNGPRATRP